MLPISIGKGDRVKFSHAKCYNKLAGEVTEWLMVPLSKFAITCHKGSFYVQIRTIVLVGKPCFVCRITFGDNPFRLVY